MRSWSRAIACILLMALIMSLVVPSALAEDKASNVSLVDVDGIPFNLTDYQEEGTVLVLNFMFLTCEPCKVLDHDLNNMYDGDDRDYEILSIDSLIELDSAEALKAYAEENGYEWRSSMDNDKKDALYRYRIITFPTVVIIDIEGNVTYRKDAHVDIEDLSDAIDIAIDYPPLAQITLLTSEPTAGKPNHLSGNGSVDPNGDVLSYHWDLGDGSTEDLMEVNHTYAQGGDYTVTLTVSDGKWENSTQLIVRVAPAEKDDNGEGGPFGLGEAGSSGWLLLALLILAMVAKPALPGPDRQDRE